MKKIFLLVAITISTIVTAQVSKVSLQASGLTCSICSNAINQALKTLDFVDKVDADIKNYTFEISFEDANPVDFDKIRKKVEDAGFSVSAFVAAIYFDGVQLKENEPVQVGDQSLFFVNGKNQLLSGVQNVKVLDQGFVPSKQSKSIGFSAQSRSSRLYHVSL
ncbi:MAG TPA: heavy-metal-associated domain-containing protein [Flavisolibacter sp.]